MGHGFEVRKKVILDKLEKNGSMLVKEIAEELSISETTIRRDLNELDSMGLLKQVYGGAVRIDKSAPGFFYSISNRSASQVEEKKLIGKRAADFVNDNDIIYIDPGTTSWEMIPYLKPKHNLTIISNSVRLVHCLEHIGHHNIIQLGGTFRPERLDTIGSLAQISIEQLRGYKAFQGGDGIDMDFGLSAIDHESALIAKIVLSNAKETYILADHAKFERPSLLYKIIEINRINYLITDQPLSAAWQEKCGLSGVNVVVAEK
jgi:DeoR family transcriptional regulator, fructose operon transcriptional repressor